MLSVRILSVDYYMSKPFSKGQPNVNENSNASSVPVPVLRIFGPTPTGEKSCVHVHGVFPYIYVPYEGGENPDRDALLLAAGIDRALQAADSNERYKATQRYVHRIRLVSGTPMYGYHARPRQFFKVYFFNPFSVRKVADLLLKGAILNMRLQPHESHVPFTLQFMMDYNLFGMSMVHFNKVKFRRNPNAPGSLENVPVELIQPESVEKNSHCFLEVDVLAEDILNKFEERDASEASNPGLAGIWAEEKARRKLKGRLSEPTPPSTQTRPSFEPFGVEVDLLKDLETRLSQLCQENIAQDAKSTEGPRTPYPAEVTEMGSLLDASVIDQDSADDEVNIQVENLINMSLVHELTQAGAVAADSEQSESGEEGDGPEGRAAGAVAEEEGAVLDMTQPLSPPHGLPSVPDDTGDSSDSEDEFWRRMADEIQQLDGVGDDAPTSDSWSDGLLSILDDQLSFQPQPNQYFDMPSLTSWCFSTDELCDHSQTQSQRNVSESVASPASQFSPLQLPDTPASSSSPHTVSSDLEDMIQPNSNRNITNITEKWSKLKEKIISNAAGSNNITLQQYINGKVVNIDFKVINAVESVVIEYKPMVRGGYSARSKFLVKPLCKFVEEWYSADKKDANDNVAPSFPKYINGFAKQKKFEPKKFRPRKHCDKECQTAMPEGLTVAGVNEKSYCINESVISKNKIMLKLVTAANACPINENATPSGEENLGEGGGPADIVSNTPPLSSAEGAESPPDQPVTVNCADTTGDTVALPLVSPKKEPEVINERLLTAVNQKFEEYYQRLMRKSQPIRPVATIKTEHEVICLSDSSSSDEGYGCATESPRVNKITRPKRPIPRHRRKQSMNPVDFVSQILSNYSSLPQNGRLPPMSITVNIGDPTAPVQVNLQPQYPKKCDGADDSSSDESGCERPRKRRSKYRPLEVSVQPSPVVATKRSKRGKGAPNVSQKTSTVPSDTAVIPCSSPQQTVPFIKQTTANSGRSGSPIMSEGSPTRRRLTRSTALQQSASTPKQSLSVPQTDVIDSSDAEDKLSARTRRKKRIKRVLVVHNHGLSQPTENAIETSARCKTESPEPREVAVTADSGLVETSTVDLLNFTEKVSSVEVVESGPCETELTEDLSDFNPFVRGNGPPQAATFTPTFPPPTREEVLMSLNECEHLEPTGIVPFYSNIKDVTKAIEVGNKALKVGHQFEDLKPWKSSLGPALEDVRKRLLGENSNLPLSALVGNKEVVITPLIKPPSRQEAVAWLNETKNSEKKDTTPKRAKILMPVGSDDSNSNDESMTLTPCTPSVMSEGSPAEQTPGPSTQNLHSSNPNISATPTSSRHPPRRRVSFDDRVRSRSASPLAESTPRSRKSIAATLPSISEETSILKKDPLSRLRRKSVLRYSTDSNKSLDMFEVKPQHVEEVAPAVSEPKQQKDYTLSNSSSGKNKSCQIQGVSLDNTFGFKASLQNYQEAKPTPNFQFTTLLAIEVLTSTRGDMLPDPQLDTILAIFYALIRDYPPEQGPTAEYGIITVGNVLKGAALDNSVIITVVADEVTLLDELLSLVRKWDPDMLAGWEIEQGSWGFTLQRAYVLNVNLLSQLSRTHTMIKDQFDDGNDDDDDVPKFIRNLRIPGRVVLNVWRLLRHEIALTSYSWENIMFHLLHERHHKLAYRDLSHLWQLPIPRPRAIPARYMLTRVSGLCRILSQLDLVSRTSELARLFGIQFEEVLTRGSQFRVESMMLRLSKPANLVPVSPSMEQRAHMRAPASLPLIMEPESRYYADPVIVLDFQSLYPSMIIAHNYCFTTCLGRAALLGRSSEPFEFGCTRLSVPVTDLKDLEGKIHISPAGVAFVHADVKRGILPTMLSEILDTRLMVKKSMKENKGDSLLQKVLHARQLGLKLIANVTYGYTAANFSGRMPCIEIGDSVVSKGRETLQRAIRLVQSTPKWAARVVYGDTDSLFVLTPGRTREEAFRIGEEIANAVTLDNPRPVKLKLEKVYQPCILQTKKRYVGYMYESAQQTEPIFEAKGIETVRRDGCPAVAKMLQKSLQILFDCGDLSMVKKYTLQQFGKLFQGRVNVQDLIFAKEYRGRNGYRPAACVPALQLAKQWTSVDKRAEPRRKERVPYVIVHGAPGVPLIRLVRSPRELLTDSSLRIHAAYYITKAIIPPMQRCFTLLGADPLAWYSEMPRRYHRMVRSGLTTTRRRNTISQYLVSLECAACGRLSQDRVCVQCAADPAALAAVLSTKARTFDRAVARVTQTCVSCCNRSDYLNCVSLDCPTLYRKRQLECDSQQVHALRDILLACDISK